METVHHDGRTTAFRTRGPSRDPADQSTDSPSENAEQPSLVFVHGSGATHGLWRAQLARLADDYTITALDLSGHGESDDTHTEPGPETLDAYARDVLAVAAAVDADYLVGNSLGGAVVLTALLDHDAVRPLDLAGVVLVGSGAKLTVHEDLRDWLEQDWARVVDFLHEPDRLFHDVDDRYVSTSREAMQSVGQAVTRRDFLSCHTFDVRDRLDEISCPLFALTGEHDGLTPPSYHEFLAEHVPNGSWTTIPDVAHLSMLEAPEAFNSRLVNWLDSQT